MAGFTDVRRDAETPFIQKGTSVFQETGAAADPVSYTHLHGGIALYQHLGAIQDPGAGFGGQLRPTRSILVTTDRSRIRGSRVGIDQFVGREHLLAQRSRSGFGQAQQHGYRR